MSKCSKICAGLIAIAAALSVTHAFAMNPGLMGTEPHLWQTISMVIAHADDVTNERVEGGEIQHLRLRPIGTISGPFDCTLSQTIDVASDERRWGPPDYPVIQRGQLVAVVLKTISVEAEPSGGVDYYLDRPPHPTVRRAVFLSDLQFYLDRPCYPIICTDEKPVDTLADRVLSKIKSVRTPKNEKPRSPEADGYWSAHALICATVKETTYAVGGRHEFSLSVQPILRLAGALDPSALIENITVTGRASDLATAEKLPLPDKMALVALSVRDGRYTITTDPTPFMPNDHAPLCKINGIADGLVLEALKAVQADRAN